MEDLYLDDPSSLLRRTYFSRTVYHRLNRSDIPISSITEPGLGSSNPKQDQAAISESVVQGNTSKTSKTGTTSKHWAISDILTQLKETVRRRFMAPPPKGITGAKTLKSSCRPKKESRWVKYFDLGVRQVSTLEKSSEVH